MKKIRLSALLCLIVFSLCACSGAGDTLSVNSTYSIVPSDTASEQSSVSESSSKPADSSLPQSSRPAESKKPTSSRPQQTVTVDNSKYNTDYFTVRDGLQNSFRKLIKDKKLTVAYLGGSITYGIGCSDVNTKSFRVLVNNWLGTSFSGAQITTVNAAIPSACSALGAYCVESDILSHDPDLVFIEYALNDSYAKAKYTTADASRHMETIVRKILSKNPACDIVFLYTTDSATSMSPALYEQASAHDIIAEHYGIMSINMGWQLRREAGLANPHTGSELTQKWLAFFSDACHPTDRGNQKYAEIICKGVAAAFTAAKENGGAALVKTLPAAHNQGLLTDTTYIKTDSFDLAGSKGWQKASSQWSDFKEYGKGYIYTDTADNELTVSFSGTSFGILGPTNREISYQVDGGEWQTATFNSHPNPLVSGLAEGNHTIKIKAQGAAEKTFSIAAFLIR